MKPPKVFALVTLGVFLLLGGCDGVSNRLAFRSLNATVQRENWNGRYSNGVLLSSEHYRIFTTCTDEGVMAFLPGFMEAAHAYYHDLTGLKETDHEQVGKVYLLASRDQWADVTKRLVGNQSPQYLAIQAGGYCYKGTCVFWDLGYKQTVPVAAHEGLHQFLVSHLRDQLPMWLEEGLCVSVEGYKVDDKNNVTFDPDSADMQIGDLRNAVGRNLWIPLPKLLSMDAGQAIDGSNAQAVAYYAELWALVKFIRSNDTYRQGMQQMLADARDGAIRQHLGVGFLEFQGLRSDGRKYNSQLSEPMFRKYISKDVEQFDKAFTAYAQALVK